MKTKALTFCILLAVTATLISQGLLTPPAGAPAPVMKTLTEIEPRANLQATPPPPGVSTADAAFHYVISQPGSYYLSANLAATRSGISITVPNVTLDLNGFQISRASGTGGYGIQVIPAADRASIRNGSVRDFPQGIACNDTHACRLRDLTLSNCTNVALHAGYAASVSSCLFQDCSGNYGLLADLGSTVTDCTATNCLCAGIFATQATVSNCSVTHCTYTHAMFVTGSITNCTCSYNTCQRAIYLTGTATGCSAVGNTSSDSETCGFFAETGSSLSHCISTNNTTSRFPATGAAGAGFILRANSSIQNCTAKENDGDGIRIAAASTACNNECASNGILSATSGAGLSVTGQASRIEGNNLVNNTRGLVVDNTRNIIVRNTARTNGSNYVIVAGNRIAQIVVPAVNAADITSANSGSTDGFTAVDPWANFSF